MSIITNITAEHTRTITVIGHVDHGKTTFVDHLLAANNIISTKMAGKIRYMDSREDEQERGITMQSSAVSLQFKVIEQTPESPITKTYTINLVDTPGHVDFAGEVSTASRLCDGALVLVDVVEGVCTQTITVLQQAWKDRAKPILIINKLDRLITELKLAPIEAYHHLTRLIEQANAIMGSFFAGERMEDDLKWREERDKRLAARQEMDADKDGTGQDGQDDFVEKDDEDLYFAPERGNVIFASAADGWGFRIGKFAHAFSKKLGMNESNLRKVLWGDFYLDPKTKRVIGFKHLRGRALKPLFVQIVLENIWAVYEAVVLNPNPQKIEKIASTLNIKILPRDLKSHDTRHVLSNIFGQWLPLSTCTIQSVIDVIPSPIAAQRTRLPKIIYPDLLDATVSPKNSLEEDLFNCHAESAKYVVASVTKMFAVPFSDLPENKRIPLSAEEMRQRGRGPSRFVTETETGLSGMGATSEEPGSNDETGSIKESTCLLGFARLYSGILRPGAEVICLLPKYQADLGPNHPHNAKYVTKAKIESLYTIMGRDLVQVDRVVAGSIFAVKGLGGIVWRSATLYTSITGPLDVSDHTSLINLSGSLTKILPIVRVALEPVVPAELPKMIRGLELLAQADPCVEYFQQPTGEYVIMTAGELHLERCLKDLREMFANIDLQASAPIVPFRETVVDAASMTSPKAPGSRGTVQSGIPQFLVDFTIRAVPIPSPLRAFLQQHHAFIRTLKRNKSGGNDDQDDPMDVEGRFGSPSGVLSSKIDSTEFWSLLDVLCDKLGGEWAGLKDRILSFGPGVSCGCILIDAREGIGGDLSTNSVDGQNTDSLQKNWTNKGIEAGFQAATSRGPLCAEPVEGVAFLLLSLASDKSTIDKAGAEGRGSQITGNLISSMKDACGAAMLDWSPRLMLAMYKCEIQASAEVLGKVYSVVARRHGRIVAEEMKESTSFFTVTATLPVVDSFGFAEDIRKRTSGAASPQLIFDGFEMLDQDPFWVPTTEEELEDLGEKADRQNVAKAYMDAVRRRKGLFIDEKLIISAEKQRTLKR